MGNSSEVIQDSLPEFELEACAYINQRDAIELRGRFYGLLKNAPKSSTVVVNALSQQLIHQLQLIIPNAFVSFDDLPVTLLNATFPYLQLKAKQALEKAISDRGIPMQINSAYRTIAQQMLLYNDRANHSNPVATPGHSNHQTGLAIDIADPGDWEPHLMRYGWYPLPSDLSHFDYADRDTLDLGRKSILAFQQLWNHNYPDDRLREDGTFSPQTAAALNQSPVQGFAKAPWDTQPRLLRLTQPQMEGSDVVQLQEALKKAGVAVAVDGEFGPATDKAVKEFQTIKMLKVDGVVGDKTRELLL